MKGFSKNRFEPSLETRSRPFFFSRASPQAQKRETLGPRTILHSRPKIVAPIQQEVAREIRCPFPPSFYDFIRGFPGGSAVKKLPAIQEPQETLVQSLGRGDPLEEGMATQFSILAWRIPLTEEPGGLQCIGSQRVRHN